MQRIIAFGAFWYDFIIGDDWVIAAVIAITLAALFALRHVFVGLWWVLPLVVIAVLGTSLWRAAQS